VKARLALAALCCLLFTGSASGFDCGKEFRLSTTREDGTTVGLIIAPEPVMAAPQWTPRDGEPPLSVSEAVEIATRWGRGRYTRYDRVEVAGIDLGEYQCGDVSDRWYYTLTFRLFIDGNGLLGAGNFVAVLMDGTLIPPTERK